MGRHTGEHMELSPTARVILGMIRLGRRTGYDIKQLVDVSTRFFWAASYGQIYPELRRLERRRLVESRQEPAGARARTEYRLTPAGERALTDWLESDREPAGELRDEGLLKLFFASGPEQATAALRAIRERHERTLERLRAITPRTSDPTAGAPLTLEYGIAFNEWAVEWCERVEDRVARAASREAAAAARAAGAASRGER
jgi:PadR family transcriptional regulator AphA